MKAAVVTKDHHVDVTDKTLRCKTIRNSLGNLFSVEVLTGMGIDPAMRAENISVAQYCQMANYLAENAPLQES